MLTLPIPIARFFSGYMINDEFYSIQHTVTIGEKITCEKMTNYMGIAVSYKIYNERYAPLY